MNTLFTFYWNFFGRPLSEVKGAVVDALPFNVTEILVWVGLICTGIWLWKFKKIHLRYRESIWDSNPVKWSLAGLGPLLLFFLVAGQGALPFSPAPTFLRPAIHSQLNPPEVSHKEFLNFKDTLQSLLLRDFNSSEYQSISYARVLKDCNIMLDDYLAKLDFTGGRRVTNIKKMRGLSRVFGLSYGGPAYHDPLTGELALVSHEDYPTTRAWRIHAHCHEIAHAKGYGREMDAEILTQLSLISSSNPFYRSLGYLMYLKKSGEKFERPAYLVTERKNVQREFQKVRKKQWVVRALSWINRKLSIQNHAKKYGDRDRDKDYNSKHPYFTTVIHLMKNPL